MPNSFVWEIRLGPVSIYIIANMLTLGQISWYLHNWNLCFWIGLWLIFETLTNTECCHAGCSYAECHHVNCCAPFQILLVFWICFCLIFQTWPLLQMPSIIMLRITMLRVNMLIVITQSVMALFWVTFVVLNSLCCLSLCRSVMPPFRMPFSILNLFFNFFSLTSTNAGHYYSDSHYAKWHGTFLSAVCGSEFIFIWYFGPDCLANAVTSGVCVLTGVSMFSVTAPFQIMCTILNLFSINFSD